MNNKLSIIGIRSKTTKENPTYFFSVESENLDFLHHVEDLIIQSLWVHGIEIDQQKRYHDLMEGK